MKLAGTNRGRATARGRTWEAEWEWEETWTLEAQGETDSEQAPPEPEATGATILREGRDFRKQAELEGKRKAVAGDPSVGVKERPQKAARSDPRFLAEEGKREISAPGPLDLAAAAGEESSPAAVTTHWRAEEVAPAPFCSSSVEGEQEPAPCAPPRDYRRGHPVQPSRSASPWPAGEYVEPQVGEAGRVGIAEGNEQGGDRSPTLRFPRQSEPIRPALPGTAARLAECMQQEREERRRRIEWAR